MERRGWTRSWRGWASCCCFHSSSSPPACSCAPRCSSCGPPTWPGSRTSSCTWCTSTCSTRIVSNVRGYIYCVYSPVFLLPLERLDLLEGVGVDVLHLLLLLGLPARRAVAAGAARARGAVPGPGRHAARGHVNIVSLVLVTIMSSDLTCKEGSPRRGRPWVSWPGRAPGCTGRGPGCRPGPGRGRMLGADLRGRVSS